jgi:hypothetical protein
MRKKIHLNYIIHITTLTGKLFEDYETDTDTIFDLITELDQIYPGIKTIFVDEKTNNMKLNAMIFYSLPGSTPKEIINLNVSLADGGKVTFW